MLWIHPHDHDYLDVRFDDLEFSQGLLTGHLRHGQIQQDEIDLIISAEGIYGLFPFPAQITL